MVNESALMLFSLKGIAFAIELGELLEVAEISSERISVNDVGGAFSYKMDFRGKEIPVVEMERRIGGMSMRGTGMQHLLVLEIDSFPFALTIDKVLGVVKGDGTVFRFPEMLRTDDNRYIKAVYRLNNMMYLIIGTDSILNDTEIAELRGS